MSTARKYAVYAMCELASFLGYVDAESGEDAIKLVSGSEEEEGLLEDFRDMGCDDVRITSYETYEYLPGVRPRKERAEGRVENGV